MKVLLIGRHTPDFGDENIEVIEQRAVTFPATAVESLSVLRDLMEEAREMKACLLLQNAPGQMAVALSKIRGDYQPNDPWTPMGVVISVPGERLPESTFRFQGSNASLDDTMAAIKFANPRARITVGGVMITITVTPPMRFKFSHIEWL